MAYPMDQSPEHDIVPQEELETVFERMQAIAGLEPGSLNPQALQLKEFILDEHTVVSVSTGMTHIEEGSVEEDLPVGVYDECGATIFTKSIDSPLVLARSIRILKDMDGRYYSAFIPEVPENVPWRIIVARVIGDEFYDEYARVRKDELMNHALAFILNEGQGKNMLSDDIIRNIEGAFFEQEIYGSEPTSDINRAQLFAFQQAFDSLQ